MKKIRDTIQLKFRKPPGRKSSKRQEDEFSKMLDGILKCAESWKKAPPLLAKYPYLPAQRGGFCR